MRVIPHSGRELSLAMAIIFNTLAEDVHTTPQDVPQPHKRSHLSHVRKDRNSLITPRTRSQRPRLLSSSLLKLFLRTTYKLTHTCNAHRLSSPHLSLGSAALVNPLKGITGPRPRVGPNPEWIASVDPGGEADPPDASARS